MGKIFWNRIQGTKIDLLMIQGGVLIGGRKTVTVVDRPFGKNKEAIPEELNRSRCLADLGLTNGDQNLHGKIL